MHKSLRTLNVLLGVSLLSLAAACGGDDDGGGSGGAGGSSTGGTGGSSTGGTGGSSTGGSAGSSTGGSAGSSSGGSAGSSSGGSAGSSSGGSAGSSSGGSAGTTGTGGSGGTGGGSGSGKANVSFTITAGTHTGTITECTFANKTATALKMVTDKVNSNRSAQITCAATDPSSVTGAYVVNLVFYENAVGTTSAANLKPNCSGSGCNGPGWVQLTYQDGLKGVFDQGATHTGTNHTGNLVVTTFNSATGAVAGSVDLGFDQGGKSFAVKGTFDATLKDCGTTTPCTGQ